MKLKTVNLQNVKTTKLRCSKIEVMYPVISVLIIINCSSWMMR